jgi:hypothetical protein
MKKSFRTTLDSELPFKSGSHERLTVSSVDTDANQDSIPIGYSLFQSLTGSHQMAR